MAGLQKRTQKQYHHFQEAQKQDSHRNLNKSFQLLIGWIKVEDFKLSDLTIGYNNKKLLVQQPNHENNNSLELTFSLSESIQIQSTIRFQMLIKSKLTISPNLRQTTIYFARTDGSSLFNNNRSKRLLISHKINKLNGKISVGRFCFDCRVGTLKFKYSVSFSDNSFFKHDTAGSYLSEVFQDIEICRFQIRKSLPQIFFVTDSFSLPFSSNKILSTQQFADEGTNMTNKLQPEIENELKTHVSEIQRYQNELAQKKRKQPKPASNIYSEIIVDKNSEWKYLFRSGFSKLQWSSTKIKFVESKDMPITNFSRQWWNVVMVKKMDYEQTDLSQSETPLNKIAHQKKILNTLKSFQCPGILKFFYSQQPTLQSSLLMEYISNRSLEVYTLKNAQCLSFKTKLHLLQQISQSLLFLKSEQIIHLDLKPANVLISRSLTTKLIDFGESYKSNVISKSHRPAFSKPYAAPEVFRKKIIFTDRLDVFSFGIIALELLFGKSIFETSDHSTNKYVESCMTGSYWQKIRINTEFLEEFVKPQIARVLVSLIFRCLEPVISQRRTLDELRVVLKECFTMVQNLY